MKQKPVIIKPYSALTDEEREYVDERAAIREMDGNQPAWYALDMALRELAYRQAGRDFPPNLGTTFDR